MFDYEGWANFQVTVTATDGTTPKFAILTIEVTDVNEVPAIDIPSPVQVLENEPAGIWYRQDNFDPEGDTVAYSLACMPATCPFILDPVTGRD